MAMNIKEIAGAFVVLFAILDITGSIPIIIDLQHKTGKGSSLQGYRDILDPAYHHLFPG